MQARGEKQTPNNRCFKEHGQLLFIDIGPANPKALIACNHCLFSHL